MDGPPMMMKTGMEGSQPQEIDEGLPRRSSASAERSREEWLEKNTISCPLGRVSKKQCQALRKRPTVRDLATPRQRGQGWRDGMGLSTKHLLTMPGVCETCKGWEEMAKKKKEKTTNKVEKDGQERFKTCKDCGKTLPASEFYTEKKMKDGLRPECKACYKLKQATCSCSLCGRLIYKKEPYVFRGEKVCSSCFHVLEALTADPSRGAKMAEAIKALAGEDVFPMDKPAQTGAPYSTNPAFDELLRKAGSIHDAKRQDYASNQDPLGNFREAERLGVSPLKSIMIRLTDKYTRACNLVRRDGRAEVKDESLLDSLLDLSNYSFLAILARQEEMEKEKQK